MGQIWIKYHDFHFVKKLVLVSINRINTFSPLSSLKSDRATNVTDGSLPTTSCFWPGGGGGEKVLFSHILSSGDNLLIGIDFQPNQSRMS